MTISVKDVGWQPDSFKIQIFRTKLAGKSCLTKSDEQTSRVMNKGPDWVESITKTPGYLLPELPPSPPPVAEMAALLLMSRMQIMQ